MTFADAVAQCPLLAGALHRGLDALAAKDHDHVTLDNPRAVAGSLNLDEALRVAEPHGHRWDYGIGLDRGRPTRSEVVWLEVHPATEGDVKSILAKKAWLDAWLTNHASVLAALPSRAVWVSSGKVGLAPGSPSRRRLASCGIQFEGRRCTL